MDKNKYYRVKEQTDNNGDTVFKVEACESKLDVILGQWTAYTKDNKTLEQSIAQINNLIGWSLRKEKTVYKRKVNNKNK